MCGIAGIMSLGHRPLEAAWIKPMCEAIAHRGPDDAGYLLAEAHGQARAFSDERFVHAAPNLPVFTASAEGRPSEIRLLLGHRRLAVLDLTPTGHQPMGDESGRVWLVYNGEIYNFAELRHELEGLGHSFRGRSDTEVILKAYLAWGIDCVRRLNGMFALALWDGRERTLHLARDRYGTKPLYYALTGEVLIFGSEIKAILACPLHRKAINLDVLDEYFTFQNLFRYETLFRGVLLLPPANVATMTPDGNLTRRCFWDFDFSHPDHSLGFDDAQAAVRGAMEQAVKRQVVADVEVGSYLSGGMDSGSITALASRLMPRMTTFTAGFELSKVTGIEATFDERRSAELMANEYRTQHFEQVINAGDLAWIMPRLIRHLEDLRLGMCYANYYVSRLASKFVKVCLSGAGGDELFGGYPWRYYRVVRSLDRESFFRNYFEFWQRLLTDQEKLAAFPPELHGHLDPGATYEIFRRVFTFNPDLRYDTAEDQVANCLYFEAKTFLAGLLLVGDKLSMAHSLEERFPFLDNDLVDLACRVPVRHKLRDLEAVSRIDENEIKRNLKYFVKFDDGKNVLREAMRPLLPQSVTSAKKQGFSSPDESWFRGENFWYVRDTLLAANTKIERFVERSFIERTIAQHSSGVNKRLLIWSLISFEEWLRQFGM